MKLRLLILALTSATALAGSGPDSYVNFVRQSQQGSGVVWDMPVAANGAGSSALLLETGGSLFQLWTVNQGTGKDYLLDQKLVGAYLPKADVKIVTSDPYAAFPRTRVDRPFSVEITVAGLLSGSGLPLASTKVLLEQHIQSYAAGQTSLDPTVVAGNTPLYSAYLAQNGKTVLKFAASSLKASDPTKALGEEHFIVHALSDGTIAQTQIASGKLQVWPVASGAINGLIPGAQYRYQMPVPQLALVDLYPRSDTYFMLYEGTSVNGSPGTIVKSYPWDSTTIKTTSMEAPELNTKITRDGTYTVALVSSTIYGNELLCPPVTFTVNRSISVNAMQVNFTDGANP